MIEEGLPEIEKYATALADKLKNLEILRRIKSDLVNSQTTIGSVGPDDGYTAGDVLGLFPQDLVDNPGDLGKEKAALIIEAFVDPNLMTALLTYYEIKSEDPWKDAKSKVLRKSTLEDTTMSGRELNNIVTAIKRSVTNKK